MVCLLRNENPQFAHKWKLSKLLAENVYFTKLYSTHILEFVPSPPQGPTGPRDNNQS